MPRKYHATLREALTLKPCDMETGPCSFLLNPFDAISQEHDNISKQSSFSSPGHDLESSGTSCFQSIPVAKPKQRSCCSCSVKSTAATDQNWHRRSLRRARVVSLCNSNLAESGNSWQEGHCMSVCHSCEKTVFEKLNCDRSFPKDSKITANLI